MPAMLLIDQIVLKRYIISELLAEGGQYMAAKAIDQKTGQTVMIIMSRDEVFQSTGTTSGTYIKVKIGATQAGKLVAADARRDPRIAAGLGRRRGDRPGAR